jgi:hypothetical protein
MTGEVILPASYYEHPDVDFMHDKRCEDREFFQCSECSELIPDYELNWCGFHLRFIPRISECVCTQLKENSLDWLGRSLDDPRIP